MLADSEAFSGFAVPDLAEARRFYADTLGLRVSELAGCMGLDASTASRHVRHLEDGGYLARTGDPGDRRASRVRLTPKGL